LTQFAPLFFYALGWFSHQLTSHYDLFCELAWHRKKALGQEAKGPWFDSVSFSLQKSVSVDAVLLLATVQQAMGCNRQWSNNGLILKCESVAILQPTK